ncbi:MAG: hypothetical protein KAI57_04355 [Candidatus Pacebacteria bacterium]|nr:hypothetical protein [Candidatus Paceibacterota bacterium]
MNESKQNKIVLLRQMIENAERNIIAAKQILSQIDDSSGKRVASSEASQIIEGTFDGEKMIGLDGKKYPVPVNYASKSKLIEGDLLKLTITEDGRFLYKQISPADRRQIIGTIIKDSNNKYYALSEGRKYNVLLASLTYFKAEEGNEVTLVVPKEKISQWAAIEAVMESSASGELQEDETVPEVVEEKEEIQQGDEANTGFIEDEWTPSIEEIKKEAGFNYHDTENDDDGISDDLS